MHDHPLTRNDIGDLFADGSHNPGQFMAEWHRLPTRSAKAAQSDIAQVAPAYPAGVDIDDRITRAALRQIHPIETYLSWGVDTDLIDSGHESSFMATLSWRVSRCSMTLAVWRTRSPRLRMASLPRVAKTAAVTDMITAPLLSVMGAEIVAML